MSPLRSRHAVATATLVTGILTAGVGAAIAFARAMSVVGTLHGMPLTGMPAMFVSVLGVLLVFAAALLRGGERRARRPQRPRRPARRIASVVAITAALTIDVSKTSTLGFVIPGMRTEYGIGAGAASMLAVSGLTGTALGAAVFGAMADRLGRRDTYLIATLGFAVTGTCGMMPTFVGNLVMCGLMGVAVGGLVPLLIATLGDLFGSGMRGWATITCSVLAAAVGYLVAAGSALWLEPSFGWRILWLIGVPSGLALVLMAPLVPARGERSIPLASTRSPRDDAALSQWVQCGYAALVGLVTFGLTTWVPTLARAGGMAVHTANRMLVGAALVMLPFALVAALAYRRYGPARVSAGMALGTALLLLVLCASGAVSVSWLVAAVLVAALFAVNVMSALFLPVTADLADGSRRGSVTGKVSFFNRLGGLLGPLLIAGLVSSLTDVLVALAVLAALCAAAACYVGWRSRSAALQSPSAK